MDVPAINTLWADISEIREKRIENMENKYVQCKRDIDNIVEQFLLKKQQSYNANALDKTPQQTRKKQKRFSPFKMPAAKAKSEMSVDEIPPCTATMGSESNTNESCTDTEANTTKNLRPVRTARLKASALLKEPSLIEKMRQPTVKLERLSDNSITTATEGRKIENNKSKVVPKVEKLSTERIGNDLSRLKINDTHKQSDSMHEQTNNSEVIMLPSNDVMVIVSDDDDNMKMQPPPAPPAIKSMPPPLKLVKKARTKRGDQKNQSKSSSDSIENVDKPKRPQRIKDERISTDHTVQSTTNTRPTRTKRNKMTVDKDECDRQQKNVPVTNTSQESVYEDAVDRSDSEKIRNATVVINRMPALEKQLSDHVEEMAEPLVVDDCDATYNVNPVTKGPSHKLNNRETMSSLMTDDNSEPEIPMKSPEPVAIKKPTKIPSVKNRRELFNPCVQSPVREKVKAFESHANILKSPAPPARQTRTKTRAKQDLVKADSMDTISTGKVNPATPTIELRIGNIKQSNTPLAASAGAVKRTVSSKSTQLTKQTSQSCTALPRDRSVEDIKRGVQALAEEKKKKREEKTRQVQQQREAKEREKLEKYTRQLEEKEEKLRQELAKKKQLKEMRDAEQRKRLEEINRNIQLQEMRREEDRKRIEAETMRKQQEHLAMLEFEAEKNINGFLKPHTINSSYNNKKPELNLYNFDMMDTDDSTDDEEKENNKRPPPPSWAKSIFRRGAIEIQSYIELNLIGRLFSAQAANVNLLEIFPSIDHRHLKRNSSAVWNTPPRYSEMPKY